MKVSLRNYFIILFSFFVLFSSFGFSFSKLSCSSGKKHVFGPYMPPCDIGLESCCAAEKNNVCKKNKKKDNRKKETFQFKIDFETYFDGTYELPYRDLYTVCKFMVGSQRQVYSFQPKNCHYRNNPPPLLHKVTSPFLQTFLI
ncbi:MAG: hypothetical protein DRJ05_01195 [Bacteroidetes bacterium]|nr:MAG: hypothetical protein DRJ05_01195 [Bacteroidota bacterium]